MQNVGEILLDFHRQGYALLPLDPQLAERSIALVDELHQLPEAIKLRLFAAPRRALTGYMPDELTMAQWQGGDAASGFRHFSGDRRRNYATFDISLFPEELGRHALGCRLPAFATALQSKIDPLAFTLYRILNRVSGDLLRTVCKANSPIHEGSIAGPTCSTFRALRYPVALTGRSSKAHTDYELVALVVASHSGLEIRGPDGEWREAVHSPAAAILIPGEMLEFGSAGAILAAEHRVRVDGPRSAAILFQGLRYDTTLSLPKGRTLCFGDHLLSRFVMGRPDLIDAIETGAAVTTLPLTRTNPFKRAD